MKIRFFYQVNKMSVWFVLIIPMIILFFGMSGNSAEEKSLRENQILRLSDKFLKNLEWSNRQIELMEWNTKSQNDN